jgi:hypothetical protein
LPVFAQKEPAFNLVVILGTAKGFGVNAAEVDYAMRWLSKIASVPKPNLDTPSQAALSLICNDSTLCHFSLVLVLAVCCPVLSSQSDVFIHHKMPNA